MVFIEITIRKLEASKIHDRERIPKEAIRMYKSKKRGVIELDANDLSLTPKSEEGGN